MKKITINRDTLINIFRRKGFRTINGPNHIKLYFEIDGKATQYRTKCSRGSHGRRLSPYHIKQMAIQLNLSEQEFMQFYECPFNRKDFIRIQKEKRGPDLLDLL